MGCATRYSCWKRSCTGSAAGAMSAGHIADARAWFGTRCGRPRRNDGRSGSRLPAPCSGTAAGAVTRTRPPPPVVVMRSARPDPAGWRSLGRKRTSDGPLGRNADPAGSSPPAGDRRDIRRVPGRRLFPGTRLSRQERFHRFHWRRTLHRDACPVRDDRKGRQLRLVKARARLFT